MCLPLESSLLSRTLVELDTIQDARIPSAIILIVYSFNPNQFRSSNLKSAKGDLLPFINKTTNNNNETTLEHVFNSSLRKRQLKLKDQNILEKEHEMLNNPTDKYFKPPPDLGRTILENLLAFAPFDQR